jgi:Xaa-Pro aminopeptidase
LDFSVLGDEEISWLNQFHIKCRELVSPLLQGEALDWLIRNTEAIQRK